MGTFSDYVGGKILDHVFRGVPYTPPDAVYLALFLVVPSDAGGGTEVSGGGYARQEVTFGADVGIKVSNSAAIFFPKATADWGNVAGYAFFDAVSGGNQLGQGSFSTPRTVLTGDTLSIAVGEASVSLD